MCRIAAGRPGHAKKKQPVSGLLLYIPFVDYLLYTVTKQP